MMNAQPQTSHISRLPFGFGDLFLRPVCLASIIWWRADLVCQTSFSPTKISSISLQFCRNLHSYWAWTFHIRPIKESLPKWHPFGNESERCWIQNLPKRTIDLESIYMKSLCAKLTRSHFLQKSLFKQNWVTVTLKKNS